MYRGDEFYVACEEDPLTHEDLYFKFVKDSSPLTFDSFILPIDYSSSDAVVYFKFVNGDKEYIYSKPLSDILSEASGKAVAGYKYSYEVTVGRDKLTFTPRPVENKDNNITDWEDVYIPSN